jgi:hypothetical protein
MHSIHFISTVHEETGRCCAEYLCKEIAAIAPEVVFLEALDSTYSRYQKMSFDSFGVYHSKLEVRAIQMYSKHASFRYVPVLDKGLSDSFDRKYRLMSDNSKWKEVLDNFRKLAAIRGFGFLNSEEAIQMQEEMRYLERSCVRDFELNRSFDEDIESYENAMVRNIYAFCNENVFDTAIFMCGVAHRKSLVEKFIYASDASKTNVSWILSRR